MARFLKMPKLSMPKLPDWNSDDPEVFEEMTLQEHLEEFRDRIIKMIIAIVPAFIIGFMFQDNILMDIRGKANAVDGLQNLAPTDTITLSFKVALYVAIAITMPIIVYQITAFLMPGMTRKEKKYLFKSLPFVTILFLLGVWYGYFIAAPRALYFLSNWNSEVFAWQPTGDETVSFFLTLMIGLGLAFQLPIIMFILVKLGVASPKKLRAWRKYSFMLLLVASAIITPSTDPFNMAVVAAPLIVLYELGIWISVFFAKTTIAGGTIDSGSGKDTPADDTPAVIVETTEDV